MMKSFPLRESSDILSVFFMFGSIPPVCPFVCVAPLLYKLLCVASCSSFVACCSRGESTRLRANKNYKKRNRCQEVVLKQQNFAVTSVGQAGRLSHRCKSAVAYTVSVPAECWAAVGPCGGWIHACGSVMIKA
jgi:hypothetical protein